MTSPHPMTRKELLELAGLDALGLLDEFEAAVYTRSYHDAPAMLQDEIALLQSEIAGDPSLLPDDEPDPSLRERVLKVVAEAIEREEARLEPLATIGPRRRAAGDTDHRLPLAASGQFWRAASFVLAGTVLVMAYFLLLLYQGSNELTKAALYDDAAKLEVLLDPSSKDFLMDGSVKVALHPVDVEADYRGSLFVNEGTRRVLVLVDDLPRTEGDGYVLQVVREDGRTQQLQAFGSLGRLDPVRTEALDPQLLASVAVWQIVELATGTVLLTSA